MKNSKVFSVVAVLLVLITAFSVPETKIIKGAPKKMITAGDYQRYSDIGLISSAADVIVKGEVIKVYDPRELKIGEATNYVTNEEEPVLRVYTVSDVKVTKVLKGNVKLNEVINIKQLGGIHENINHVIEDEAYIRTKENHVLFLEQYDDSPYSLLNPTDANVKIENKNTKSLIEGGFVKDGNEFIKEGTSEEELFNGIAKSLK